jgi:hypothetical protein
MICVLNKLNILPFYPDDEHITMIKQGKAVLDYSPLWLRGSIKRRQRTFHKKHIREGKLIYRVYPDIKGTLKCIKKHFGIKRVDDLKAKPEIMIYEKNQIE